jgi:hypothetical protein
VIRIVRVLAIAIALAVPAGHAAGQAPPTQVLRDSLALLPADVAEAPLASLDFADWQAIIAAAERDTPLAIDRLAVGPRDYRPALRAVSGPDGVRQMVRAPIHAGELVGFEWDAVGAALEVGRVPEEVMVLRGPGPADRAAVGAALLARGFEEQARDGAVIWHRLADGALSPDSAEPADPFWGLLGSAARVSPVADGVIAARLWPLIARALDPEGPRLGDAGPLASLLDAVDRLLPEGARLVQAVGFDSATAGGPALGFAGGLLVDAIEGEADLTLVLVSHDDAPAAAAMSAALAPAFSDVTSGVVDRTYHAVIDRLVGTFEVRAATLDGLDRPVAALVIRTTRDPAMSRAETNYWTNPAFGILADALLRRDLTFVATLAEARP